MMRIHLHPLLVPLVLVWLPWAQAICSKGTDNPVVCDTTTNRCDSETVVGCDAVTCQTDSCGYTSFIGSSVTCQSTDNSWDNSCNYATFNQSRLDLEQNAQCRYCQFWFSAVSANQENSITETSAYNGPSFQVCSCCEDQGQATGGCPPDVPRCTELDSFCSETYLFRSCKDWGNPVCEDTVVETAEPVVLQTNATTCSAGVDTVWCTDQDACGNLQANNCTILCGEDSCANAQLEHSVVGCYNPDNQYADSCEGTVFSHSIVDLHGAECQSCTFWFSAVTTNGPFSAYSFRAPLFWFCSCCDDLNGEGNCPEGVPSCAQDPVAFCSNQHYFRTCQQWGNPICDTVEIMESTTPEFQADASTCSEGVDTVWCTDEQTCDSLQVSNCTVLCGQESCGGTSVFEHSVVSCVVQDDVYESCESATFNRSYVELLGSECRECSFWFSAVTTNGPFGSYSYSRPEFGPCTCCDDIGDDDHCPPNVPSCQEDPVAFCSTVELGRTCQEWGNPVCANVDISETLLLEEEAANVTNATIITNVSGVPAPICSLSGEDAVVVCSGLDCAGGTASNCTLECYGESCGNAVVEDSGVACLGEATCAGSTFFRSFVDCTTSDCKNAEFFSSSLHCNSIEGDSDNCDGVVLSRCSCCSGDNCVPGSLSCDQDEVTFCNSTYAGRTCADWKHPKCKGIELPSLPPFRPAETCNLNEEIVMCDDGINGCLGLDARNCTVLCSGPVCNQASFEDSVVACIDLAEAGWFTIYPGEACVSATFFRSIVTCQNSCVGTSFVDSYVSCVGQAGCPETSASFDECSCCDGLQCPFGVPGCEGNIDAICSRVVDGENCACRGFPACEEEHLAGCPESDSSVQKKNGLFSSKGGVPAFWP
ncbi:expressed unknown protein [Seminavis robusta]|uniref:SRCR domain-containing protein n=1 Tax=Seminavis robusta TaxID=568900 RepID=A0A9N8HEK8_9STRA|nr:expressed unknown protein [Seminavis robusta]|eukprot:Sro308_g113640.1 n/a (877) ;mRNA; f:65583-68315